MIIPLSSILTFGPGLFEDGQVSHITRLQCYIHGL